MEKEDQKNKIRIKNLLLHFFTLYIFVCYAQYQSPVFMQMLANTFYREIDTQYDGVHREKYDCIIPNNSRAELQLNNFYYYFLKEQNKRVGNGPRVAQGYSYEVSGISYPIFMKSYISNFPGCNPTPEKVYYFPLHPAWHVISTKPISSTKSINYSRVWRSFCVSSWIIFMIFTCYSVYFARKRNKAHLQN